ncbi:hypothetical protein G7Y89_g11182 [Cudoniella acicularis]|uniref:DUF1776-domain-containing protein n=1 Tax=Cudoniella acicularis TaxID=354080 RepID=A0A8H4RBC2_9HELO|nr:hypothetical protein G7Y89_g11182 [Cudoniella acicularis]
MSADDQAFLDVLSSVPNDIRRYSNDVADYVDKHLEKVSNVLREALSSSQWIPEPVRPKPPPLPPRTFIQAVSAPTSTYTRIYSWVTNHKILTTVIVLVVGGVTYHIIKKKTNSRKKRRAKRAANGARFEVVIIAGSPSEPITRSLSLDLERRGFIVYIVCNTIEEEVAVHNEARQDIRPLMIDITDPSSARASIDRFTIHLQTPHTAFQGAKAHHLNLRSLILIPSSTYPSQPIATLSPSTLSDLLNTRLLIPILTLQTFLPLLQQLPLSHPHLHASTAPATKPSVLVLTPSIIANLTPAFHLPESSIVSALNAFTTVLSAELSPLNIRVIHLQMGTFDTSAFSPHNKQLTTVSATRAETLKWDDTARSSFGRNFVSVNGTKGLAVGKGSSLRELNDAVFDAMVRGRGGVVRVGMGSVVYGFVGRWVPQGLVGWMMGVRNVADGKANEFGKGKAGEWPRDRSTSPGSSSKMEESEYDYVYKDRSDKGVQEVLRGYEDE